MSSPSTSYASRALAELVEQRKRHQSIDSSLVFADVSSFTPLTERLARRGRVGSEQLTELLNDLFGPTLDAALDRGGDLLSFGGDALLIHVRSPDHEHMVREIATAMMDAFTKAARRHRVGVQISVGVASGLVHLHRCGRRFNTLVVHGPAVAEVQRLETAAAGGQILAADGPVTSVQAGGNGTHRLGPPPAHANLVDPSIAAALDRGDLAEHRRAVIGFIRYVIDPASTPEELDRRFDHLFATVEDACLATGVALINSDIDPLGGKLTLTAGVPTTTGDDADRLIEAAIRIRDGLDPDLKFHIGINEGPIFAGPIGSEDRQTYTVMGDDVNLAARVAGKAPSRGVVATRAATDRARQGFHLDPLEPFQVKGKSNAIEASIVGIHRGGAESGSPQGRASPGALRGRECEMKLLNDLAGNATRGVGSLVEIVAPAGVGKSRLVEELRRAAPLPAVTVEGGRYLARRAYGAVAETARRMIGARPAASPAELHQLLDAAVRLRAPHLLSLVPLLATPLGFQLSDNEETAALTDEFRKRLIRRSTANLLIELSDGPVLLLIEDAHWLDEATVELLEAEADRFVSAGWMVVATRRPESSGWRPADVTERINLASLDRAAARSLAGDLALRDPLPDHLIDRLVQRSDGNPLFLEQLVRSVAAGADPDELPDRVEVLIEARIDQLEDGQRSALRTAAVLGARFPVSLIEAVDPVATSSLAELGEFLALSGEEVRFHHALYREAAYVALPERRRRDLHRRTAEALEKLRHEDPGVQMVELLATHWHLAREPARAWPFLREAADRAQADLAPYEALRFLEQALAGSARLAGSRRDEIGSVREQLGLLAETVGRFDLAERCFSAARKSVADPAEVARLLGLEARVARSARSLVTAGRRYRRALGMAPPEAHRVRADLLVGHASVLERQGRHHDKLPILTEALAEAEAGGDPDVLAHAHMLLGNAYGDLGDPEAVRHLDRALSLFESTGNLWGVASARNNLGVESYYSGEMDRAVEHYRAAGEGYRRIGDESNVAMTLNNIGEIHSDQGGFAEAAEEFSEARRIWRAVGFVLGVGLASSNLGRLSARQGFFEDADAEFEEARRVLSGIDARGFILELDASVAAARVAAGRFEEGIALAEATLERGEELQPTVRCGLLRTHALGLGGLGRTEAARLSLDAAVALAAEIDAPQETAECDVVRSVVMS